MTTPQPAAPASLHITSTPYTVDPSQFSMVLKDSYLIEKLVKMLPPVYSIAKVGHTRGDRHYLIRSHSEVHPKPPDATRSLKAVFTFAYFISPVFLTTRAMHMPAGTTRVHWLDNPRPLALEGASRETLKFLDDDHFVLARPNYTYYPGFLSWVILHNAVRTIEPIFAEYNLEDCRFHMGRG